MNKFLEIGRIINKRGIRGELKVEPYSNSEEDFFGIKTVYLASDGTQPHEVISCKPYNGFVYLKINGVETPEQADKLRNKYLYVDRDELVTDEDEIFIADLIGLDVIDANDGTVYGQISDVLTYSHYDTYVISYKTDSGKGEYMLPAVDEFIDRIELEKGVFVTPIPGLFEGHQKTDKIESNSEDK